MVKTSTRIVGALALAAALVSNGPVSAAQPLGLEGDLSANRTSAEVIVPVDCGVAGQTTTGSVSVKIFQSVGRLLNIGTGSGTPNCTGQPEIVTIEVNAIPGLKFQPGPATILITLTETTTSSATPPLPVETGARIDLRP